MNFSCIDISSQFILWTAAFFLSTSRVLIFFLVYTQYSPSIYLADCTPSLQRHSGKSNPGTFLECSNLVRLILYVFIWTTRALGALKWHLGIFSVCFVGFSQMVYSSLPVFLFGQTYSNSSRVFCSDASLMVTFAPPTLCFSPVCLKFHFIHFLFILFVLLHPVASLVTISASSLPLMFLLAGIH